MSDKQEATTATPEQEAVIRAAEAYADFMMGFRVEDEAVPFVDALLEAVNVLRTGRANP